MIVRALIRVFIVTLGVALALGLSACASPGPGTAGGEVVQSLPQKSGLQLTYSTFNAYNNEPRATVRQMFGPAGSRIEGMDYEAPAEGGFTVDRARTVNRVLDAQGDLVRLERTDGSSVTYDPPMRVLPVPLRPGMRFRQTLSAQESDGSPPRKVIVAGYVAGWENVKVPAGEFRALRIVRDSWLGDHALTRTQTQRSEVDWYSPEIGAVVRSEENSLHEDRMTSVGDSGQPLIRRGDWLRWELRSVERKGV